MNADPVKSLYEKLSGANNAPLEDPENHPFYVPILQNHHKQDPILRLRQRINWSAAESLSLLTGFRGNGKSTELNRLKALLEGDGCRVIKLDMADYLHTTKPVEIGDFLLSFVAALGQELARERGQDPLENDRWEQFLELMGSKLELDRVDAIFKTPVGGARIGAKLSREPTFKEKVQAHLRGHLATLSEEVNRFVIETVSELRGSDPDRKIVILVDSVEHIRGVGSDRDEVHKSVVDTFSGQRERLRLPRVHMVYTVPPFLLLYAHATDEQLIALWPNIHVRDRQGRDDAEGLALIEQLISRRFPDDWSSFLPRDELYRLARTSGGDIRDLFLLLRESLVTVGSARALGESDATVDAAVAKEAIARLRDERRMMLTEEIKQRLAQIHRDKALRPDGEADIPKLVALLDANLIMNYQNGAPWYDVHPVVESELSSHELL